MVYTAEHLSLAMIEYLVHVDADNSPADLMLAVAEIPDHISRVQVLSRDLPPSWRQYPAPEALAAIGDAFATAMQAAILIVPSALAVTENNWILNPAHPEFRQITIKPAESFQYEPRLLSRGR